MKFKKVILLSIVCIFFISCNNYNTFKIKFKNIKALTKFLKKDGKEIVKGKTLGMANGIYGESDNRILYINEQEYLCLVFKKKKHWSKLEKTMRRVAKEFGETVPDSFDADTYYNAKCVKGVEKKKAKKTKPKKKSKTDICLDTCEKEMPGDQFCMQSCSGGPDY